MYFTGIIIAICTFLTIGIWHPIVIKTEYYWGTKPWIIYLLVGVASIIAALFIENTMISAIVGVFGASALWGIGELFEQKKRVERGWFPKNPKRHGLMAILLLGTLTTSIAQELQVKININTQQVGTSDKSVFENLQQTLEQWMNERQWTDLQFQQNERIAVSFNLTVTKYDKANNRIQTTAMIQANRPVWNSSYTTILYNNKDANFDFDFAQFDQLNYNDEQIDNQLTALMAYYAYLIIGLNLDSFSPLGGTDVLQRCMQLTNNAQDLGFSGWKAFETSRNRFAIINDYLDEAMKPFRQLQYDYYRKGLDEMAQNAERGRTNVTEALQLLKKAHEEKPLSLLPQIWTDYKRDELAYIYKGKGTAKEKEAVYDLLFNINASQSNAWNKIKE